MSNQNEQYNPGTPADRSGIWERTDGREVAVSKEDRLPPGREGKHDTWHLKRPTHQPPKKGK